MRRPNSSNLSIFLSVVRFEPLHLKNIRFSPGIHHADQNADTYAESFFHGVEIKRAQP
jgi:hypothetical protein